MTEMEAVLVGGSDPEIAHLESRMRRAQLSADVEALDALIADELLFTGPAGDIGTKAQDLEAHRSGAVRFHEHDPQELRIRRAGPNVAVTALRARLRVEVGGAVVSGTYRYTRVWAQESDGKWQVVGGHVSEVPGTGLI
jgi:ketosteroid isomerase-like protein